jgi:ribulose-bisphosphate carboxylase large chain
MKVAKRPFVGTIIKPKLGLNAEQHSKVAFEAWLGGCDIVKDDENLSSMVFNNFDKRVRLSLKAAEKAERITGERKGYLANVTAESKEMLRRARLVEKLGGRYIMVDILSVGWSALQTLRNENLDLILHAHRAGHAALTRNKRHGISMLTIAKLCRLAGLDQLHIGAVFGKMEGGKKEVAAIDQEIEKGIVKPNSRQHVLAENWCGVKPMLAVCSGGLEPSKIPLLVRALGNDIVIQLGGGIHGHLSGTLAGAKAARQALEATMSGIPLRDYAKKHSELATALKTWQN